MARVPVRQHLHHHGALARLAVLDGVACRLAHRQHVHPVHLDAGDVVAARVVSRAGRGARVAGAHAVAVVLADEDGRQVPQLGHVVRLEGLALVGGAVAVQRDAHAVVAVVLLGECQTCTQRYLSTNDTIAAVEVLDVHVHGATLAARAPGLPPRQLGQDAEHVVAEDVGPAVRAVGRDDLVMRAHGGVHADGARLLSRVQVAEAPDDLLLVQVARARLEAPDGLHAPVVHQRVVPRHRHAGGRAAVQLVQLEGLRLEASFRGVSIASRSREGQRCILAELTAERPRTAVEHVDDPSCTPPSSTSTDHSTRNLSLSLCRLLVGTGDRTVLNVPSAL